MTVKDPRSWWAYFLAVFQQGGSMMIIVVMQGYVAKRTPKMIRGITNAVMGIMGSLGSLPYLLMEGIFVKMWGARMVWGTMAFLDSLMLVFLVIMILMGKYGGPPHINDHASDRGADEGQGGYEDIPDLGPEGGNDKQKVYHEHILEASERFEESTYRGSEIMNSMVESRKFTVDKRPDGM